MARGKTALWVEFSGGLGRRGAIPIDQVAHALLAVQRITNKVYLHGQDRLTRTAVPSLKERNLAALTLGRTRQGSLGIEIVVAAALIVPTTLMLQALSTYVAKKALTKIQAHRGSTRKTRRRQNPPPELIGAVYPQVLSLVRRVERVGAIEKIRLEAKGIDAPSVTLDAGTQKYVRQIGKEPFYGEPQLLEGQVKSLWLDRFHVVIERPSAPDVRVHLPKEVFDEVPRHVDEDRWVSFEGQPVYRLGVETLDFTDFRGTDVWPPRRRAS